MKKYFFFTVLLFVVFFVSCEKENVPKPSKNIQEMLVGVTWGIQEITFVQNNELSHYERGAQNNDHSFDGDFLTFEANNDGTYATGPVTYNISWEFIDAEKTKLRYTIFNYDQGTPKPGSNTIVTLENINLTESHFKYAEIYTDSQNKSTMSSVKRIPMIQ